MKSSTEMKDAHQKYNGDETGERRKQPEQASADNDGIEQYNESIKIPHLTEPKVAKAGQEKAKNDKFHGHC